MKANLEGEENIVFSHSGLLEARRAMVDQARQGLCYQRET